MSGQVVPMRATAPVFTGEIHPYADRFPMLSDEDLDALAADIKANGLRHPIVLDPDGVLIDGRNRLEACARAGIEPEFITDHGNPVAIIMSENLQTRPMTNGQRAHLAVLGLFNLNSSLTQSAMAVVTGVSQTDIAKASIVRRYTPQLADAVIDGRMPHTEAYAEAKKQKDSLDKDARQRADLADNRPDLHKLVERGDLSLSDALIVRDRETAVARQRAADKAAATRQRNLDLHTGFSAWTSLQHSEILTDAQENYQPLAHDITGEDLRSLAEFLLQLSKTWRAK